MVEWGKRLFDLWVTIDHKRTHTHTHTPAQTELLPQITQHTNVHIPTMHMKVDQKVDQIFDH